MRLHYLKQLGLHRTDSHQNTKKAENRFKTAGSVTETPKNWSQLVDAHGPVPTNSISSTTGLEVNFIWLQEPVHKPPSFPMPLSMSTIKNVPFCQFCLAGSYLDMQCPAIWPQIRTKLMNTQVSLPTLPMMPWLRLPNAFRGPFRHAGRK